MTAVNDKRLVQGSETIRVDRQAALGGRRYCKYCYRATPQFLLTERSSVGVRVLRCCWECGSGLEKNPKEDA